MSDWPGIIATLYTEENGQTTPVEIHDTSAPLEHSFSDRDIRWRLFAKHRRVWASQGRMDHRSTGYYRLRLYRLDVMEGGRELVDTVSTELGEPGGVGSWQQELSISATMQNDYETYELEIFLELRGTFKRSKSAFRNFIVKFHIAHVGDLTLDYVPIGLVYSPPNQDMSASLTQSEEYGARFTVGRTWEFQSELNSHLEFEAFGALAGGTSTTDSHSLRNSSEAGIEFSYFRRTVLTADNQRAIGRAYWGPLGDLFVIAVNLSFAVSKHAGIFYYNPSGDMDQILVVPAYKLLRPGDDPVVSRIPSEARKELLALDPFITNLTRFFPQDQGLPLSVAANPYADPTVGNRAERLGRWWLNTGTALNYSIGESKELRTGEATEQRYRTSASWSASGGVDIVLEGLSLIGFGAGGGESSTATLAFQSSQETVRTKATSASAYLIRNQNSADLDGIEIYYDKIFSSLMFRRVKARPDNTGIIGVITDVRGQPVSYSDVRVYGPDSFVASTTTDVSGRYELLDIPDGSYEVHVEATKSPLIKKTVEDYGGSTSLTVDLHDVRYRIDMENDSVDKFMRITGIDSNSVSRLSRWMSHVYDEKDLAFVLDVNPTKLAGILQSAEIVWPSTPLDVIEGLPEKAIQILQNNGIDTVQHLWRRCRNSRRSAELAELLEVSPDVIDAWRGAVEMRRASVSGYGSPPRRGKSRLVSWSDTVRRLFPWGG